MKKILLLIFISTAGYFLFHYIKITYKEISQESYSPYKKYGSLIPGTYRVGLTNTNELKEPINLQVIGEIPSWINGHLLRNGPGKFTTAKSWISNWFDGLAMINSFNIKEGNVIYFNKFLNTTNFKYVNDTQDFSYLGFLQDPPKAISNLIPHKLSMPNLPNANVNIITWDKKFLALTEIPLPIIFDSHELPTDSLLHFNDNLPETDIHTTPHPHYDKIRKELISFYTQYGWQSYHNLYKIKENSTKREIIAKIPVNLPSYMHSFSITEKYAILIALPLVVNPLSFYFKKQGFIKYFKWLPQLGTKFIIIDRINNKLINIFQGEPFFAFHTVNAFEQDSLEQDNLAQNSKVIIDIVTYKDHSVIYKAYMLNLLNNDLDKNDQGYDKPILKRFAIDLATGSITSRILSDNFLELPRINYDYNGKDYNYLYAFAQHKKLKLYIADKLVKINVKTGKTLSWHEENCYPGEPIFIAKPQSKSEDDGVILSVVLDAKQERSFLLFLDAKNFKEIARAIVPQHISFGIHGNFFKI